MTQQVHGPTNAFWELMDLSDTSLQVDGPPVYFTYLLFTDRYCNKISIIYNYHNLLSTCNMIWLIIKPSTNEIDTHYDSML
jgi:hypothetical protein